jgi:hypothetical protein
MHLLRWGMGYHTPEPGVDLSGLPSPGIRAVSNVPLLLMIGALYAFLPQPVSLNIWPGFAQMTPATFVFVVITPRHPDNREACFEYEGPERKSFCWSIAGEKASRASRFEWPFRSSGEYLATATVTRIAAGKTETFRSQQPFRVIGFEP